MGWWKLQKPEKKPKRSYFWGGTRAGEGKEDTGYDFFRYAPGRARQYFGIRRLMRRMLK